MTSPSLPSPFGMMASYRWRPRSARGCGMVWTVLLHLVGLVADLVVGARRTEGAKDLEIALLRHQVRLLLRRSPRPPRLSRWETLTLAVLAAKLGGLVAGSRSRLS